MVIGIISRRLSRSSDYTELGHFTLWEMREMRKQRFLYNVHAQLLFCLKSFCSPWRCRCDLLRFSIIWSSSIARWRKSNTYTLDANRKVLSFLPNCWCWNGGKQAVGLVLMKLIGSSLELVPGTRNFLPYFGFRLISSCSVSYEVWIFFVAW